MDSVEYWGRYLSLNIGM